MAEKEGVVLFGPWIGEFGWELMAWQAWCREQSKRFEKTYVCSFPDMEPLYQDFAEFIPHTHQGRALDWDKKENIDKAQFELPKDITAQILPFKKYRTGGEFRKFGFPTKGYDYLLHARGIGRGGKDYPLPLWLEIAKSLPGRVASIGSALDHYIPDTADMRDVPLNVLMDIMAGCDCVIGQSSGVMHLAALCGARLVVWGDSRTYFGETLKERYEKTWNPLKNPVSFIFDDQWKPAPDVVVQAASVNNIIKPLEDDQFPSIPTDLMNKLATAMKRNRYLVTVSIIDKDRLYHYYKISDFPDTDLLPSLEHLARDIKDKELSKKVVKLKRPQIIDADSNIETGIDKWT